ncbi:hypothetical protein PB01_16930 [Psychrobacillus glaciei]|uniref:Uncharacterized protein n=1 Tax=Psychrobacillus glaciei TaxID=2283160 RepID=A0A5J6SQW0_9BACI|nr:hypothetical protein [Psychrobacillus glaciei]QFG00356.1 hypothetical protein PB01_16930 [Psychrobacillus glaciei]
MNPQNTKTPFILMKAQRARVPNPKRKMIVDKLNANTIVLMIKDGFIYNIPSVMNDSRLIVLYPLVD